MPDAISRLNAALEGRYRVERELGQGGMATVYLARDLRHDRNVALKVLKPELAAVIGAQRFLAEIRTTANLQHPHILPLFDSGEADTFLFYVMPYVEGETLRDRLDREHQLPVDVAVRIAANVAEGLDYAHRHGVIHRDIKPANILLPDGKPMISDFGIALAVGVAGEGRLTETGLSLGTPHYMSPEQATGDMTVGATTDVYALGCVLYEMLVGEPPYTGSTAQAVLGKIIAGDVASPARHRRSIPAHVDAAVRRALEKLPADRFPTAQALADALADASFRHGSTDGSAGGASAARLWKGIAAGFAALSVALGTYAATIGGPAPSDADPERLSMLLPPELAIGSGWSPGLSVTISPDGKEVVYVSGEDDVRRLVSRSLSEREARDVPGTDNAVQPFFSPDGRWLAFGTGRGELRKVPFDRGAPVTLVTGLPFGWSVFGTWTEKDEIVFASEGLRRVPADGGAVEQLTQVDPTRGERGHVYPEFLPGTRTVLFTAQGDDSRVEALDLDTGRRQVVIDHASEARYLTGGYLLFKREQDLVAVPFDPDRLATTGPVVALGDIVRTEGGVSARDGPTLQFAVSRSGTLAFLPPSTGAERRLGIVGRDGTFEAFGPEIRAQVSDPRVSPDGRTVSFSNFQPDGTRSVYLYDLARGSTDRVALPESRSATAWRPTDRSLSMFVRRGTEGEIRLWSPTGTERPLVPGGVPQLTMLNMSWSPDGTVLAYTRQLGGEFDIWTVSVDDPASARPLIASAAWEFGPRFSPDGRWLAYLSNESGSIEAYIRRYPGGERLRVSSEGAGGSVWSPDGRELFMTGMHDGRSMLLSVSVTPDGETLRLGAPTPLFELRSAGDDVAYYQIENARFGNPGFDVLPDGSGFVMVREREVPSREIVLVRNVRADIERLTGS